MTPVLNMFDSEWIKNLITKLYEIDPKVIVSFEYELDRHKYCFMIYDNEMDRFWIKTIDDRSCIFSNPSIKFIDYRFYSPDEFIKMEYRTSEK